MFQSRIFEGLPPLAPKCSDQKQFSNLAFPQRNLPPERDRASGVNPEVFSSSNMIASVSSERIAPLFQNVAFTLRNYDSLQHAAYRRFLQSAMSQSDNRDIQA
jgi:hypothetical protein